MPSEQLLACPECGGVEFSVILKQIYTGPAYEFDDDRRDVEAHDAGPIFDSSIGESGLNCRDCGAELELEHLVEDQWPSSGDDT